jgi:hypothetical protein
MISSLALEQLALFLLSTLENCHSMIPYESPKRQLK